MSSVGSNTVARCQILHAEVGLRCLSNVSSCLETASLSKLVLSPMIDHYFTWFQCAPPAGGEIVEPGHRFAWDEWNRQLAAAVNHSLNYPCMSEVVEIPQSDGTVKRERRPNNAMRIIFAIASSLWIISHETQQVEAGRLLEETKPSRTGNLETFERTLRRYYTMVHGQQPTEVTVAEMLLDKFPASIAQPIRCRRADWAGDMGVPDLSRLRKYLTDSWNESEREQVRASRVAVLHVGDTPSGLHHGADNLVRGAISDQDQLNQLVQKFTFAAVNAINQRQNNPNTNNSRSSSGQTYSTTRRPGRFDAFKNSPIYQDAQRRHGTDNICFNCLKPLQRNRACCKANSSCPRQYSSVVFATAKLSGKNVAEEPGEVKANFLVDCGSQVTAMDADAPAAVIMKWSKPTSRLTTANGDELRVLGEAWVTLTFEGGVKRVVKVFKVKGLSVEAVLGTDVLFANGICSIDLRESTGRGRINLGRGEEILVWTPEDAIMQPAAIQAGMRSVQIRIVGKRQEAIRPVPVKIDRRSVLATLEESNLKGEVKMKTGPAEVTIRNELSPEELKKIREVLQENRDAFANNDDEVGIAKGFWVNIDMLDRNPVTSGKNRRVPVHIRAALDEHLRELERQNLIRRSRSPYCSGVVVVHKSDGSIRLCIDYKDLNAKTADDGFQLPLVEDQLNQLQGSQFFTKLDLYRGYHQLLLAPNARAKTAFSANGVHYEYLVLPFGPKNGPAAFARFVFEVLGEMHEQGKPVAIFFDDIIIGGGTFQEHVALVREVLERLKKYNVTVKSKKASVAVTSIECLGYIVDRSGIRPAPEKVEGIINFPIPEDLEQLRAYLGTINFYGWMVPKLQQVLRPLNQALSKDIRGASKRVTWTEELDAAFKASKQLFVGEVLTYIPDFTKPFIVTTDASETGVGAILSQMDEQNRERPIAFYSKGLDAKEFESSDAAVIKTRELELYAFLLATRKWRSYLYGKRFQWYTDHKPLLWDEKNPTKKVANWISELKELDFESRYLKGVENTAADALSRHAHAKSSERVLAVRAIVVAKTERTEILRRFHDAKGHPGGATTLRDMKKNEIYWPGMAGEVMKWCATCDICQKMRSGKKENAPDEPTSQATEPFSEVAMDLVQIDDQQMLVVECMFTRWAETTLLGDKSAAGVYKAACELLFDRYGIPELLRTDNGNEFNCLGAASFQLGFEWRRCSPHNPSSQGMIERANQSILNGITKLRAEHGYGVDEARRVATRIYNARVHKSTGHSPFKIVMGKEPNDPDLVFSQKRHNKVNLKSEISKYVTERASRDREVFRAALERDATQKERRQPLPEVERFKVGDLVLVPRVNKTKTEPRRQGPYEVIQVRAGNVYRLKDTSNFRRRRLLYHHRKLTRYTAREAEADELQPPVQENPQPRAQPRAQPVAGVNDATPLGGGIVEELSDMIANNAVPLSQMELSSEVDPTVLEQPDQAQEMAVVPWVDPEEIRSAWRQARKEESKERRPEPDAEGLRRTKRVPKPNPKYAVDLLMAAIAKFRQIMRRKQNWEASHQPMKQLALRMMQRLVPLSLWGEECRNRRSYLIDSY